MLKPKVTVRISPKLRAAVASLKALGGGPSKVQVGFPAGKVEGDIVQRAIWNEFGTRGGASGGGWGGPVPERPFMRNSMRSNRGKYQRAMAMEMRAILRAIESGTSAGASKREILERLGILAQGDIKAEITSLSSPANAPLTIQLKGSSNPLIDTGEMRAKTTWKIVEE